MLLNVISTSVHLCLSWPLSSHFLSLFFFHLLWRHPSFSVYLFISLQHRVQRWRTLSNRLTLASSTTQVIRLSHLLYSLSLPPSVTLPLPSPYFGLSHQKEPWQVDGHVDGQMTSQFPPWLICFTLELQNIFGWLEFRATTNKQKKTWILKVHWELSILICHSLLHERWHRSLLCVWHQLSLTWCESPFLSFLSV